MKGGFDHGLTKQTDFCDCRVAFVTENVFMNFMNSSLKMVFTDFDMLSHLCCSVSGSCGQFWWLFQENDKSILHAKL